MRIEIRKPPDLRKKGIRFWGFGEREAGGKQGRIREH